MFQLSVSGMFFARDRSARPPGRHFDPLAFGGRLLRLLPPNFAHRTAIRALKYGLAPTLKQDPSPVLATRVWDIDFANPVGLAAGFDKDAEALDGLLGLGFGFVEAGTVTPRPQDENPRPNLFRLEEDAAVINRLGFPSQGLDAFARRLARPRRAGVVGANVGINRDCTDPAEEFATGIARLAPLADYLVINVSSPNTSGLRDLQRGERMSEIIAHAREARDGAVGTGRRAPLIIKIAPDLDAAELDAVARAAIDGGVDGLCAGNTTITRPDSLHSIAARNAGGLSGPVLLRRSTEVLATLYRLTEGRLPLIGCGGIASGADAYAKIRAGASLIQFYTALIYGGPGLARTICADLARLLVDDGFAHVADAVGADHR
ncbi:MAG: quinone-dependent dihydroorotate dehydrogenase [Alphaproteobacteria bacterium]